MLDEESGKELSGLQNITINSHNSSYGFCDSCYLSLEVFGVGPDIQVLRAQGYLGTYVR